MATAVDRKLWAQWQREIEKAPPGPQPATTISGVPIEPLYTPDNLEGFEYETDAGLSRPVSVHARHSRQRCIAAGCGRCGSSPVSAPRGRRTSGFDFWSTRARRA